MRNANQRERLQISFEGSKGRTKQSMRDECDINTIMKRWQSTGHLPDVNRGRPTYGDFSEAVDYTEALRRVQVADEEFARLSSRVRARFDNNPAMMLEFMLDDENVEEAIELGLLPEMPKEEKTPPKEEEAAKPPAGSPDPKNGSAPGTVSGGE